MKKSMYSLDCSYFSHSFDSIEKLIDYVINSGMDPNYEITKNGENTGERVVDLINF